MDLDLDGKLDFVSGSYDPGEVFFFRGMGKARFREGAMLVDEAGVPIVHHPVEFAKVAELREQLGRDDPATQAAVVASYGSFPTPIDCDGDGDVDLVIGSLAGEVFVRERVPLARRDRRRKPAAFATTSVAVDAGGARLKVHSHADPFAADWDGDGRWDLVVGAGDGSVGWYRNEGDAQAPRFGPRQELVAPKSETDRVARVVGPDGQPQPGCRAQICVADYDGDGRMDLLTGDFATAGTGEAPRTRSSYVWLYLRSGPLTPRPKGR